MVVVYSSILFLLDLLSSKLTILASFLLLAGGLVVAARRRRLGKPVPVWMWLVLGVLALPSLWLLFLWLGSSWVMIN